jgi:CheY-like chemotaxis protein
MSIQPPSQPRRTGVVLVVDDDQDITEIVEAVLTDEGFTVSCLVDVRVEALREMVGRLEPDCVLLDSSGRADYGSSWETAAYLTARGRRVPVIMFSAFPAAVKEAEQATSERSVAASFSAIVRKPFDVEDLLAAVAQAVSESCPFDRSPQADAVRTQALVARLRQGGAIAIRRSTRREWVTFRTPRGSLVQLYWWQERGVYLVGRYTSDGTTLEPLGHFAEVDGAISVALQA